MKKILSALLALLLVFSLAACGGVPQGDPDPSETVTLPVIDDPVSPSPSESESPTPDVSETPAPTGSDAPIQTLVPDPIDSPEPSESPSPAPSESPEPSKLDEHGSYTTAEDVALYLVQYGHLPENFITKNKARDLGWSGGSLEPYAPGKCIGGDRFGNNEGLLPKAKGRTYTECDIDTLGAKSRGAKRIVFSNDGLIYYTDDHYESFTLLYGEE